MKIVQKFSHAKQSETIPASGAVNESDHRDDSESACGAHDRTPVSPVPTFRNRVGGLGHLSLVILFLISGFYAAKRDLSSFTLNALFLMLIGGYDWMRPMLQRNARVTTGAVLHTEADRDDSSKSPEPSRLSSLGSELQYRDNDTNLLDEHILRPERLVTPADDVSGAEDCEDDQRPPLLEIDPDVLSTADSRRERRNKGFNRSMRVLKSRVSGSYLVPKKPRDPHQPPLFGMPPDDPYQPYLLGITPPQSLREFTTRAGDYFVDDTTPVVPTRMPYRVNLEEHIDQDSDETGSALSEDTATEIDPTTADKPSRKKERRAKRQRKRRKEESLRKKVVGAANLKKVEEMVECMFNAGWVPGDMNRFLGALGLALKSREEIYEELVREGFTSHGYSLYDLMSRWEREPGAMNKKEEERIQRLIKGSWLEDFG